MFQRLLVVSCTPSVLRTITSYAERRERYVRADQARCPDAFAQRRQGHCDLFTAVVAGSPNGRRGGLRGIWRERSAGSSATSRPTVPCVMSSRPWPWCAGPRLSPTGRRPGVLGRAR